MHRRRARALPVTRGQGRGQLSDGCLRKVDGGVELRHAGFRVLLRGCPRERRAETLYHSDADSQSRTGMPRASKPS